MITIDKALTKKLALQTQTEITSLGGSVPTQLFLSEEKNGYLLRISAPSVEADSYKVEIKQGHLIVASFVEFASTRVPRFIQAFPILPHVDSTGIEARYLDGELQIFAPFKTDGTIGFNRNIDIQF